MYSNVTPPALPAEYDSTAYPYYVLAFNYTEGTEDWYSVNLFYSATAFICCTEEELNVKYVTTDNATQILSDGTRGWGTVIESVTPSITPGLDGNVYTRIYTNHNIFDTSGKVWLAADSVTAVGVSENWLRSFWAGVSMGLCGKAIFSKGEPVPDEPVEPDVPVEPDEPDEPIGYFYGRVARTGETADRTIDGVGYVGEVLPKLPDWDTTEFPYAVINLADFNKYGTALLGLHYEPCYFDGTYTMFGSPGVFYRYQNNADRAEQMGIPVGEWVYAGMMLGNHYGTRGVDWSNHDIINTTDDSVYLESTDPIPVYE